MAETPKKKRTALRVVLILIPVLVRALENAGMSCRD